MPSFDFGMAITQHPTRGSTALSASQRCSMENVSFFSAKGDKRPASGIAKHSSSFTFLASLQGTREYLRSNVLNGGSKATLMDCIRSEDQR